VCERNCDTMTLTPVGLGHLSADLDSPSIRPSASSLNSILSLSFLKGTYPPSSSRHQPPLSLPLFVLLDTLNILLAGCNTSFFLQILSQFAHTMCDYTQVEYSCGHLRYTVKAWCVKYQQTQKRCGPNIVCFPNCSSIT
jgi:hypothetical protein